jgi:hypothetical protein
MPGRRVCQPPGLVVSVGLVVLMAGAAVRCDRADQIASALVSGDDRVVTEAGRGRALSRPLCRGDCYSAPSSPAKARRSLMCWALRATAQVAASTGASVPPGATSERLVQYARR